MADITEVAEVRTPFIECPSPANDGPMYWVANAAIDALDKSIRGIRRIPNAPRLSTVLHVSEFIADENGNTKGGIRTPHIDAPVATLTGLGQGEYPGALSCRTTLQ